MFSVKRLISSLIFKVRFRKGPNQFFRQIQKGCDRGDFDKAAAQAFILALTYPRTALTSPTQKSTASLRMVFQKSLITKGKRWKVCKIFVSLSILHYFCIVTK